MHGISRETHMIDGSFNILSIPGHFPYIMHDGLKESAPETEEEGPAYKSAAAPWKPQLPFVWDVVLDQLLPQSKKPTVNTKGSFPECLSLS